MSPALLPCPFSGAKAHMTSIGHWQSQTERGETYMVRCLSGECRCMTASYGDEEIAAKEWNTRIAPERALRDGVQEILDRVDAGEFNESYSQAAKVIPLFRALLARTAAEHGPGHFG